MNITTSKQLCVLIAAAISCGVANSAEKVRFYPFGEADDGAAIGGFASETEDI